MGAGIDHRHLRLLDLAEDFDEFTFGFRPCLDKVHLLVGAAQSAIESVEIETIPRNVAPVHPFAAGDSLSGFAEIASRLDGNDQAVENVR
ncbi:MAG: hypothetical protein E6Q77_03410 [Rhizobium sp.]|nr:MAG: hypothetical protein E6Q77_03410 [Rhizobium sp.]